MSSAASAIVRVSVTVRRGLDTNGLPARPMMAVRHASTSPDGNSNPSRGS